MPVFRQTVNGQQESRNNFTKIQKKGLIFFVEEALL